MGPVGDFLDSEIQDSRDCFCWWGGFLMHVFLWNFRGGGGVLYDVFFCRFVIIYVYIYGWFLKWWGNPQQPWDFPTKNDHFGVFRGYHH